MFIIQQLQDFKTCVNIMRTTYQNFVQMQVEYETLWNLWNIEQFCGFSSDR